MATREDLHRLIDGLPEEDAEEARRYLQYLQARRDPMLRSLIEASEDDEPETEGERAKVAEARQTYAAGDWVSREGLADGQGT